MPPSFIIVPGNSDWACLALLPIMKTPHCLWCLCQEVNLITPGIMLKHCHRNFSLFSNRIFLTNAVYIFLIHHHTEPLCIASISVNFSYVLAVGSWRDW